MDSSINLTGALPEINASKKSRSLLSLRNIKVVGLGFLFGISFQTYVKFPIIGMTLQTIFESMFLVSMVLFFMVYMMNSFVKSPKYNQFELLTFTLLLFPIYSGIMTNIYFGQPFIIGVLAQKQWVHSIVGIYLFYLLKTKKITLYMIRDAMLFMTWFLLPIYIAIILTMNPNKYDGSIFVYCNSIKGGCTFELEIMFFAFACFYYWVRFLKTNQWKYILYFLIFFAYIFFINQKRGTSLALVGALGLYFIFNLSFNKILYYSVIIITSIIFALLLLEIFRPDIIQRNIVMWTDIIDVLQGEQTNEASANARIKETLIAVKYLTKNDLSILFGNGKLSNNWQNGPLAVFGHFFASDIGILGVIFQYGIFGLIIGEISYIYSYIWYMRIKNFKSNHFLQSVFYFLIFYLVRGIPTGGNFFPPGVGIVAIFLTVIYFFYYIERRPSRNYKLD